MVVRERCHVTDASSKDNPLALSRFERFITIQTLTILPAPYRDQQKPEFPRRTRPKKEPLSSYNQWIRMNPGLAASWARVMPSELPALATKTMSSAAKPSTWDPYLFSSITSGPSRAARMQTDIARSKLDIFRHSHYHYQTRPDQSSSTLPSVLSKQSDHKNRSFKVGRLSLSKNQSDDQWLNNKWKFETGRNRASGDLWFPPVNSWEDSMSNSPVTFRRRRFSIVLPTVPEQIAEPAIGND